MNILAISGSLRKDSFNTALVKSLQALAPEGMQIDIVDITPIKLFNQDDEAAFPREVQNFKDKIVAADGIIIATPEYNHSIPGVLKNVIDWASRPYGQNSFDKKKVLIMGVSIGKNGAMHAQVQLKELMTYLGAEVIEQELHIGPASEIFDEKGAITSALTKALLTKALGVFAEKVKIN